MIDYLGSLPMWMQGIIIIGTFILVFGFIGAVIYKIITAERIKAGPTGVEIDSEDEPEPPVEDPPKRRRKNND